MSNSGGYACCVPKCSNRSYKETCNNLSWHTFPNDTSIRCSWLKKIKGNSAININLTKYSKVCSDHFHPDQFRPYLNVKRKRLKHGSIPLIFSWNSNDDAQKIVIDSNNVSAGSDENGDMEHANDMIENLRNEIEEDDVEVVLNSTARFDESSVMEPPTENNSQIDIFKSKVEEWKNKSILSDTKLRNAELTLDSKAQEHLQQIESLKKQLNEKNLEIVSLKNKVQEWENKATKYKSRLLNVNIIKQSTENCRFYTGLSKYEVFKGLVDYLEEKAVDMQYWDGKKTKSSTIANKNKTGCKRKLSIEEEFFLVLVRLRLGMPVKELARIYSLSEASISNTTTSWIHLLYFELQLLQPFPSKAITDLNRPTCFYEYPNTRIILDCTEFRVDRPSSILAQRATFSSYKNYNTFKCLIGVSPAGMITFVSKLYGGATSDRFIVEDCKVLELLEPGDDVMADKGFEIQEIMPNDVTLNIPPQFRASKERQMPSENVSKTKAIAKVRVHVERAIRRIKTFHIFDSPVPMSMADEAEKIVMVCALLTNFMPALIKGEDLSLLDESM